MSSIPGVLENPFNTPFEKTKEQRFKFVDFVRLPKEI